MLTLSEQQKIIDELTKQIDPVYFEIAYKWLEEMEITGLT